MALRLTQLAREFIIFTLVLMGFVAALVAGLMYLPYKLSASLPNLNTYVTVFSLDFALTEASVFAVHQSLWGWKYSRYILAASGLSAGIPIVVMAVLQAMGLWCAIGSNVVFGIAVNVNSLIWTWGGLWFMVKAMRPQGGERVRYEVFALFALHSFITSLAATVIFFIVGYYITIVTGTTASYTAFLGVLQEYIYSRFGKEWQETMFYSHLLSLPFFGLFASDIAAHAGGLTALSKPFLDGWLPLAVQVPDMWAYLFLNCCTQYLCIRGVYTLTGHTDALTCTLTISIRKFASLIISVIYFGNHFSAVHWVSSAMVFAGTGVYALAPMYMEAKAKAKAKAE